MSLRQPREILCTARARALTFPSNATPFKRDKRNNSQGQPATYRVRRRVIYPRAIADWELRWTRRPRTVVSRVIFTIFAQFVIRGRDCVRVIAAAKKHGAGFSFPPVDPSVLTGFGELGAHLVSRRPRSGMSTAVSSMSAAIRGAPVRPRIHRAARTPATRPLTHECPRPTACAAMHAPARVLARQRASHGR